MWQALLAIGVAAIGFLGVVIGAVVAGYFALRQAQLSAQREREAHQMLRWQVRKDAHDVFQRDAVLSLQGAVFDYLRVAVAVHDDSARRWGESGEWPTRERAADFPADIHEHSARIRDFRARVFDEEVRRLALEVAHYATASMGATDRHSAESFLMKIGEVNEGLQQRVNTVLRELFLF
jgi:hypothetical protein